VKLASADGAVSIGNLAVASGVDAVAIGNGASAAFAGSAALGAGATATAANQVALGGTGSAVRIGDIAASTAAQVDAGEVMTVDANGVVGVDTTIRQSIAANTVAIQNLSVNSDLIAANTANIASNAAAIADLQGQTATLFDLTSQNAKGVREANEGVAMALSMESPVLMPTDSFGVAGGFGYYNNRVAGSASFAARINDNAAFTGGFGIGFDEGEVGARAGFQVTW